MTHDWSKGLIRRAQSEPDTTCRMCEPNEIFPTEEDLRHHVDVAHPVFGVEPE